MTDDDLRVAVSIFADIPDDRADRGRNHSLSNILTIALSAVISGAESYREMQTFAEERRDWLENILDLPHGIPDHDTIRRVFARLDPTHFQTHALDWIRHTIGGRLSSDDTLCIDGKRLRGASRGEVNGVHLLNVWSARHGLCLTATSVDGKSNEITALPGLLDTLSLLELAGCLITLDAMGTQREVARKLTGLNAQYLLALKGNHPNLLEDVQEMFSDALRREAGARGLDAFEVSERGHGREERRECWVLPSTPDLDGHDWPGLQSVVLVRSERVVGGVVSVEERFFLSSLPVDAERALRGVRTHWEVENRLHWVMDVQFGEDANRTSRDHGPENLAVLRRLAGNLLRLEPSAGGVARKRKRAAWNDDFRSAVLAGLIPPPT